MEAVPYYLMMLVHLTVFGAFTALWWQDRRAWPNLIMMVITGTIAYDNFMIGFGQVIGDTSTLLAMSRPRFWVHGVFTPLIMLVGLAWARDLGVPWARTRAAWVGIGVVAIGLSLNGFRTDVLQLDIETTTDNGLLRYTYVHPLHSLPASVIAVIVLIAAGIGIWKVRRSAWLLGGSVFMFVASGGGSTVPYVANLGETVLVFTMFMTAREAHQARRVSSDPAPREVQPAG
jgi:hypothetical protein